MRLVAQVGSVASWSGTALFCLSLCACNHANDDAPYGSGDGQSSPVDPGTGGIGGGGSGGAPSATAPEMHGDANAAHEDAGTSGAGAAFRAYLEGDAIVLAPLVPGQPPRRQCSGQIIVQK